MLQIPQLDWQKRGSRGGGKLSKERERKLEELEGKEKRRFIDFRTWIRRWLQWLFSFCLPIYFIRSGNVANWHFAAVSTGKVKDCCTIGNTNSDQSTVFSVEQLNAVCRALWLTWWRREHKIQQRTRAGNRGNGPVSLIPTGLQANTSSFCR